MKRLPRKTKILLFFVILTSVIVLVVTVKKTIFSRHERLLELEEEVKNLRERKSLLEKDLRESEKREFVEKEARERLNMVYPGETVVIIPKGEEDSQNEIQKEGFNLWRWLRSLVAGEGIEPSTSAL